MVVRTFIEVNGRRIEYKTTNGASPPVALLFLHEGLGSVDLWRSFPDDVAKSVGIPGVSYSRLGHGWSDPFERPLSPRFHHEEAEEVLPEVRRQLTTERPWLIGHSDGASIALVHAATGHPVAGLVLIAPHVFVEDRSVDGIRLAIERSQTSDMIERLARHHRDPEAVFRTWSDIWTDPTFQDWNIESLANGLDIPILAIQGIDDQYGTMRHLDSIESRVTGPFHRLEIPDCGHSPHVDHPTEVINAITTFITTHS